MPDVVRRAALHPSAILFGMLESLEECAASVREIVTTLDADRIAPAQADRLLSAFVALERAAVAGKLLCAAKAAQANVWRQEGHRSAAEWLAQTVGTSVGPALATLSTAEQVSGLSVLTDALRRGELSEAQAEVIARSASVAPATEAPLVEAAGHQSLKALRATARRLEAAAGLDDAERFEAVHRTRYLRHWREADGAFRLSCRMTEDTGLRILEAVNSGVEGVWREALTQHHAGGGTEAYRLDALERLVVRGDRCMWDHGDEDRSAGPRRGRVVHLRVDAVALRRGSLEDGDVCEVPGVGPISLAAARALLPDSVIKLVITDGVDVQHVTNTGRHVPAALATALVERDPVCVVPGCDVAVNLEVDHYQVDWSQDGATELWNLARLCHFHHGLKTYRGYSLVGGPGDWEFIGPDGTTWRQHLTRTHPDGDPMDLDPPGSTDDSSLFDSG